MKLDVRQQKIVDATEDKILCLAASGAGKTRVLTERIKRLLSSGVKPTDIIAITFTNMAAEEIKKRLPALAEGMYIGTIHGYANFICILNGFDTTKILHDGKFDVLIDKGLLCTRFQKVKHLLVDEFQDTCPKEFAFMEKIPAENKFFIGDERQFIYGFKGSSDKYLRDMYRDVAYTKYFLTKNYRSAPNIIRFADDFLYGMEKLSPPTEPVKEKNGEIVKCSLTNAIEEITWDQDWKNWFILCRTNAEVEEAIRLCNINDIPNVSFRKSEINLEEFERIVKENKVKVLTIHAAKGWESPNVIVVGAKRYNQDEQRICYVAATRAENRLYWCPSTVKRGTTQKNPRRKIPAKEIELMQF